jgi:hypothetical protein
MIRSLFKKTLALTLGIIVLIGLFPLNATAADGISISGVRDSTSVTATINNLSLEDVDALMVFAVYRTTGVMIHVEVSQVKAAAGKSVSQKFSYDILANPDYIYKLFAWEPLTYIPLCAQAFPGPVLCVTVDGNDAKYDGLYVVAAPEVNEFMYVKVDEAKKTGMAYTAKKSGDTWTHTRVEGANVIITYKPSSVVGAALPVAIVSPLDTRVSGNANKIRIVISL